MIITITSGQLLGRLGSKKEKENTENTIRGLVEKKGRGGFASNSNAELDKIQHWIIYQIFKNVWMKLVKGMIPWRSKAKRNQKLK